MADQSRGRARDVQIGWAPQAGSQVAFLSCPLFEVLIEGNRGGGKTDALLMDFAQFVGRGYGQAWRGILFRQTHPQLADVIAKSQKWFPRIWPSAKFNQSKSFWEWPTGETLLLRHFERDAHYWNYHGHEYPWIGWEELCNWATPNGYKLMMSCCRSSHKGVPRHVRATTNPYGPGHNWVKSRFRLPAWRWTVIRDSVDDEGELEPERVAIPSSLSENAALLEADPGYLARIRAAARNKAELDAWISGSWDIVAGGMFDDVWDPRVHVVDPFAIPHSWRLDRSFDWGSSKPFSVGWWAESDGSDVKLRDGRVISSVRGDLFRVAEWYGWNGKPNEGLRMLAVDVARGVVEREVQWRWRTQHIQRVRPGPADGSIFVSENGPSIAHDMAQRVRLENGRSYPGVTWGTADKSPGSRKTGWEQVRQALKNAKPKPEGPREHPGLFVFRRCDQFLRTFPVLPRDPKDPDDLDTNAEDHIADETRYRVRFSRGRPGSSRTVG